MLSFCHPLTAPFHIPGTIALLFFCSVFALPNKVDKVLKTFSMVSSPVVTAPSAIPSISNHSDDNLMEIYENCNLKKWCYSFCLSHSWDALTWFKLLTWFTLLPWFNQWDLPCDIYRKIQTFKLGATLRSLLPSLPGSEMRVGSLLKINPSLNVDQEKRQESDDKNWAEARTWTTEKKHQEAKGKRGFLSVFKIRKSGGVAL